MSKDTIQSFKFFGGGGGNSRAPHPLYETLAMVVYTKKMYKINAVCEGIE